MDIEDENLGYHSPKDRDRVKGGMIDNVALAIGNAYPNQAYKWEEIGSDAKNNLRILARAAIAAMQEPTEAMQQMATDLAGSSSYKIYKAMIKVALEGN